MRLNTLPKKIILKRNEDIVNTLKFGKVFKTDVIKLHAYKNDNGEGNVKIAFIVKKKLGKKAVVRVRIKRWLRELYRTNKPIFPCNYFFILAISVKYDDLNYKMVKENFYKLVSSEKFINYFDKIV